MRDIAGFEGRYSVTRDGRVWSHVTRRWIDTQLDSRGFYKRAQLVRAHGRGIEKRLVHRIVAVAYLPNPLNKPQVNHKNGIKTDNDVRNLEWCTASENRQHAIRTGLIRTYGRTFKTHCDHGHRMSGKNVAFRLDRGRTSRRCRTCWNEQARILRKRRADVR